MLKKTGKRSSKVSEASSVASDQTQNIYREASESNSSMQLHVPRKAQNRTRKQWV